MPTILSFATVQSEEDAHIFRSYRIFCLPSENGVYSKRKEFAPMGSKFFHFKVDPFLEGVLHTGKQTGSHESFLPCQKWWKMYQIYPLPMRVFSCIEHHKLSSVDQLKCINVQADLGLSLCSIDKKER